MPLRTSRSRHRLEFAFAVVATVGAVYGLSRFAKGRSQPTTSELPPFVPAPPIVPRADPPLAPSAPAAPAISSAFLDAAGDGDVDRMRSLYMEGMALRGALGPAAASGHPAAVGWLLDHGADVHEDEAALDAPLLLADAHPSVVKLLLDRGAVDPELRVATIAGAPQAMRRLLDKGANPNARAEDGSTPMFLATARCRDSAGEPAGLASCTAPIRLLAARGARVNGDTVQLALNLPDELCGPVMNALLSAPLEADALAVGLSAADGERHARFVRGIVASSKATDWVWHDGEEDSRAPLLDAIDRLDVRLVRAMLDAGAPADTRLKDGRSALGVALERAASGEPSAAARIIDALLAHGASVNRRLDDGRTPLFAAAAIGDVRIVGALLDRGARVNDVVLDSTALDEAEHHGRLDAARVLQSRGGRRVPPLDDL